jgi:hypothetical protein
MISSYLEPIADEIVDKKTARYPNHTIYTHLGCVLIRTLMGLILINAASNPQVRSAIIVIMILSLIVFGYKYLTRVVRDGDVMWKAYPRMLVAYSAATYLATTNRPEAAGIILIADALMGAQSRHMASVLSCGLKK